MDDLDREIEEQLYYEELEREEKSKEECNQRAIVFTIYHSLIAFIQVKQDRRDVLEGNPKWDILVQALAEIEQDNHPNSSSKNKLISGLDSYGRMFISLTCLLAKEGHVLIVAKDEKTCMQLQEYLLYGGKAMLKRIATPFYEKETVMTSFWLAIPLPLANTECSKTNRGYLRCQQQMRRKTDNSRKRMLDSARAALEVGEEVEGEEGEEVGEEEEEEEEAGGTTVILTTVLPSTTGHLLLLMHPSAQSA